jgi:hypothetical protein
MTDRSTEDFSPKSKFTSPWRSISRPFFILLLVTILLNYPWIMWGLVPGHDSAIHLAYFHSFNGQLRGGEFYPRWLTDMNDGAGSPIFFMQYPFPYFAASAFHYLLNLPVTLSGESYALGLVFFFAAIFLSASLYLWCSRLVDPAPAAVAAVVGLTLPYVLWFDFYVRNAIGECIALACIPLALYFCHDLNEYPRRAVSGIALSFCLIIASHLFSVVMLLPFLGLYVLAVTRRGRALHSLIIAALGTALGAGLSGVYLLPMLAHRRYFDLGGLLLHDLSGNYLYDNQLFPLDSVVIGSRLSGGWFLSWLTRLGAGELSGDDAQDVAWWFLSWLTRLGALLLVGLAMQRLREGSLKRIAHRVIAVFALVLVVLSVAAPLFGAHALFAHADRADHYLIVQRSHIFGFALLTLELALLAFLALPKQYYRRLPLCFLGGAITCFLLMTRWTAPLWEHMHFLWNLQFPWRFSGLLSIFTTGLIAFLFQAILRNGGWRSRKLLIASSGFAGLVLLGAIGWQAPERFLHHFPNIADGPQRTTDQALNTYLHASELANNTRPWLAASSVMETRILQGTGSVRYQTLAARRRSLEVDCSGPCTAQVHLLYYPAWVAHDFSGAQVALKPSPESGLITLTLPSGYHNVQIELPRNTEERLGPWVTTLSLIIVLIIAFGASRGIVSPRTGSAHRP